MIEKAQALLQKHFGYSTFKKGQTGVISSILAGQDTFAVMPTGAGKSVCFQIPALLLPGVTLVISPLISLMKDQVDGLNAIGVPTTYINSSLDGREIRERLLRAQAGRFKLIYVAPERLELPGFREILGSLRVSLLAVDEAHCVSQWGHDFRPSYRSIARLIKDSPERPVVAAFTATATEQVKHDVIKLLHLQRPGVFVTGFDRENLFFAVVKGMDKRDYLRQFVAEHRGKPGIIYAATRKEVDAVCSDLLARGYKAGRYHAGMPDAKREENQDAFLYDEIEVMVATNAFGMGIDKSNVRYVLHYNMPKNIEAYYQEAGRAGRDGEPSDCVLLFEPRDIATQKYLIEQTALSAASERKGNEYQKLQAMVDYCHTNRCLRQYLLEYFAEQGTPDRCGKCGNCCDESELEDITVAAQKVLSCIYRMRERYGTTLVAQVLKGSKNKKVLQFGFDRLSTYGIMDNYTEKEIKNLISLLVAEGYASVTEGQYPLVQLGEKAPAVLKGQERVFRKVPVKKAKTAPDNTLFELLRRLRKEISAREHVPPYVIFHDSVLREMSEQLPRDPRALGGIKGVGEHKLHKYGEEFLNVINEYLQPDGPQFRQVD